MAALRQAASQRAAGGVRRAAAFSSAAPRVALRQQHGRIVVAAAEPDMQQPSSGNLYDEDMQRAMADALTLAELEKEFISGEAGSEETVAYLDTLAADKLDAFLDAAAAGSAAAVVDGVVSAAAEDAEGAGIEEVEPLEEYAPAAAPDDGADPLALYDNATAAGMRQLVAAAKLSPEELAEGTLVPEDWDQTTIDWFTNKKGGDIPLPTYRLNFLWQQENIAVAVDQVYARGAVSPLTQYYMWPRNDAWEELRVALEAKPWMTERDKILLLNRLTEVINFWQEPAAAAEGAEAPAEGEAAAAKRDVGEARAAFPDCVFAGAVAYA